MSLAAKLAEQFPTLEEGGALEELLPKKDKLVVAKRHAAQAPKRELLLRALTLPPPPLACSANHVNLVVANNQVLFFNIRDGPYFPTLRVLHKCKSRLRVVQQTHTALPDANIRGPAQTHTSCRGSG